MFGIPIAFASPWILVALATLPAIWWLLRLTPPRPQEEVFPPTRILGRLAVKEETPAQSPWWLTLLRLTMAGLVILAMAGPVWNPEEATLTGDGPVLIVMDDGWASAQTWDQRRNTALGIIAEAEERGRAIILESTTGRDTWNGTAMQPAEAASLLEASEALPFMPNHQASANRISEILSTSDVGHVSWLSDGLMRPQTQTLSNILNVEGITQHIFNDAQQDLMIIERVANEPSELFGNLVRADSGLGFTATVVAKDIEGVVLARANARFAGGENRARFTFDQPVELRNQITRLEIENVQNAAAVQLLDEANRRRLVGLVSGEKFDQSQPLLSPLYYISRAIEPFSDIRRSESANVSTSIDDLIKQNVSAIALADVGLIPDEAITNLSDWIEKGGLLIRFAGPRLAASSDNALLPVEIRPGDRNLGGALSWETPKPLAPFERKSPFFGIEPPREVLVQKQLLALQETRLEEKTWAVLEDGTPLVTADQIGNGWIVLFHVGSDAEWSNLPLSGTFVEMLRRVVNLSKSFGFSGEATEAAALAPLRMLSGEGNFEAPDVSVKPLILDGERQAVVSMENPPGFYGSEDAFNALNLFESETNLTKLDVSTLETSFVTREYVAKEQLPLKVWLLTLAALLLILDCIAVLWMAGALRLSKAGSGMAATLMAAFILSTLVYSPEANAQSQAQSAETEFDYTAALQTRLAYVNTGLSDVDRLSEQGLKGLTLYLSSRTALEPGDPVGLDISQDELSFYSLIYWPVDPRAELPTPETMARIDAFMKQGGSILFDTKDQISGAFGGTGFSPAANTLQQILSTLDIPPLEPVPSDHVLTKSFYLLDTFPGRYTGGDLWVETTFGEENSENRPARAGDGVSSILITSNDMAGAWAIDDSLRSLLPTVPPDPRQRTLAYRVGVNLMMYALTGNYKADQVHLPALLERLGQ